MSDRLGPRRVMIEDVREDGKFLRTTWHPAERAFVVSTWDGDVCVGATRLDTDGAAELIGVLTSGLANAASLPAMSVTAAHKVERPNGLVARLKAWTRRNRKWAASPLKVLPNTSSHEEKRTA